MVPKVLLGIAGAPTVVVDSSLYWCHYALADSCDVWALLGGPNGLIDGAFAPINRLKLSSSPAAGSVFAAGRRAMTIDDIELIVRRLADFKIQGLVLAGGNGTMALLKAIDSTAKRQGFPLITVGIPKTVDNDLLGVDFSPGFATAARYLTQTVPDIARDHRAMASIEPIRIVETIGRGVGWLALSGAAALSDGDPDLTCDLYLIPECADISESEIFGKVEEALQAKSRAFVVCSEGFPFRETNEAFRAENRSKLLFGGVARRLARALESHFDKPARGEVLGTQQRSARTFASAVDLQVARLVGQEAGKYVLDERGGVMVGTRRAATTPLSFQLYPVTLADVAGLVRPLPPEFWQNDQVGLTKFNNWLRPLTSPTPTAIDRIE
jgi:ATP-dependent phosphofructokinase / diphosphate-dependent phosphofructokinase